MPNAIVKIEGKELKVDEAIAKDDNLLRDLLSTSFPEAKTAQCKRTTVNGQMIVTVNKQPGKKGGLVEDLLFGQEAENPCVTMARKLATTPKLKLSGVIALESEIRIACEAGRIEANAVEHAMSTLLASDAVSVMVPPGF
jgi:hypothetical protein